jgi:hypothetical protein
MLNKSPASEYDLCSRFREYLFWGRSRSQRNPASLVIRYWILCCCIWAKRYFGASPNLEGDQMGMKQRLPGGELTEKTLADRLRVRQFAFSELTAPQKRWLTDQKQYISTVVAHAESPAMEVICKVTKERANLVVIVGNDENVEGVFVPDDLMKQVQKKYDIVAGDLAELLSKLSKNYPDVENHERIVFERPKLYWCAQGAHWTSSIPCPQMHQ